MHDDIEPSAIVPIAQIFANRTAGNFRATQFDRFCAKVSERARVIISDSEPGSPLEIDPTAHELWAFGGDGTVRQIAAAAVEQRSAAAIGIFPAGTVNLLARELAGQKNVPCAHPFANGKRVRQHFAGRVNGKIFLVCASAGPDSQAVEMVSPRMKRMFGKFSYVFTFIKQMFNWHRTSVRLNWEGGELDCEAVYIAKGRYFCGPWSFAPQADVQGKDLHVVALLQAGRWRYFHFLLGIFLSSSGVDKNIIRFTCRSIEITGDDLMPVQADGDIIDYLPVKIFVDPQALLFIDFADNCENL